jgi:hypothetical protein
VITRTVTQVDLMVCENGHVVSSKNPRQVEQFLNSCGHWVWFDANFCGQCGHPVDEEPA